jgi:hypothetical protein
LLGETPAALRHSDQTGLAVLQKERENVKRTEQESEEEEEEVR